MDVRIKYKKLAEGLYISYEYFSARTLSLYHVLISIPDGLVALKDESGTTISVRHTQSIQRSRRLARKLLMSAGVVFGEEVHKKIGD